MDGQYVGAAEQFVFADVGCPGCFGGLGGQVGAPRNDVHAERRTNSCHAASDPAQSQHAQHRPTQLPTDRGLPATCAYGQRLVREAPGNRQDQRPGQLDSRLDVAAGRADVDTALLGGRHVDRRVERPRRGDHSQLREPLNDAAQQRCSFAHYAHDVEGGQPLHDRVGVEEVIIEDGDLGVSRHRRPVGHAQRDVLVVVENRNLHCLNLAHCLLLSRQYKSPQASPALTH